MGLRRGGLGGVSGLLTVPLCPQGEPGPRGIGQPGPQVGMQAVCAMPCHVVPCRAILCRTLCHTPAAPALCFSQGEPGSTGPPGTPVSGISHCPALGEAAPTSPLIPASRGITPLQHQPHPHAGGGSGVMARPPWGQCCHHGPLGEQGGCWGALTLSPAPRAPPDPRDPRGWRQRKVQR